MNDYPILLETEIKEIEAKANGKLAELHKTSRILGSHVLNIVKKEAILLQAPFDDEEFCAFVCQKKGRLFVYINSQIPGEKQNFAAAHELYHIWFDKEYLTNPELLKSNTLNDETDDTRELRANLFAAVLLVPRHVLEEELLFLDIGRGKVSAEQAVELAHIFQVPYKSLVRRLYEIDFIGRTVMKQLLHEPKVEIIRKKLQLEQPKIAEPITHFEGLVEQSIHLYQAGMITLQRLRNLLALVHKQPEDFGMDLPGGLPSEAEIDEVMEEDENE